MNLLSFNKNLVLRFIVQLITINDNFFWVKATSYLIIKNRTKIYQKHVYLVYQQQNLILKQLLFNLV